jgi:cysteinyl-tRNA synthetase
MMNYSEENTFPESVAKEKYFTEFFRSVKAHTRGVTIKDSVQKWDVKDFALQAELLRSKKAVRVALCDSFDTSSAVNELATLVSAANIYLQKDGVKLPLVLQVSRYVFDILKVFGVYDAGDLPTVLGNAESGEAASESVEDAITPVMNALSNFRD